MGFDQELISNTIKSIDHNVSHETFVRLEKFVELLIKWNSKINLISENSTADIWWRHIVDSMQLLKFIDDKNKLVTDFGSGAGFPGIILSLMGIKKVALIESNMKKSAFLAEAASLSNGNIEIHNTRIDQLSPWQSDVITARALASLSELLDMTDPFRGEKTYCLFHKGKTIQQELEIAKAKFDIKYSLHQSITAPDSYLINVSSAVRKSQIDS